MTATVIKPRSFTLSMSQQARSHFLALEASVKRANGCFSGSYQTDVSLAKADADLSDIIAQAQAARRALRNGN